MLNLSKTRKVIYPVLKKNGRNEQWLYLLYPTRGSFWLVTRPDYIGEVSQAGPLIRHQGLGVWWSSVDKKEWPDSEDFREMMKKHWDKQGGDKRQEIVFIGLKDTMDIDAVKANLDNCVIRDYWQDPEKYQSLSDPFPKWFQEEN